MTCKSKKLVFGLKTFISFYVRILLFSKKKHKSFHFQCLPGFSGDACANGHNLISNQSFGDLAT